MIIDHNDPRYQAVLNKQSAFRKRNRHNGGYYYSTEIVKNIIPFIKTDRNWMTVDLNSVVLDHTIAFVHHNIHSEWYERWKGHDAILVCGMPETVEKVKDFGHAIYLPMSVDVEYVKQFYQPVKDKEVCFVGRREKRTAQVPDDIPNLWEIPRSDLLTELAHYKKAYAVDRCAIECNVLGVEVLEYGYDYGVHHGPEFWKVRDNREMVPILQAEIDKIDNKPQP